MDPETIKSAFVHRNEERSECLRQYGAWRSSSARVTSLDVMRS